MRLLLVPLCFLGFGLTFMNTFGAGLEVPESLDEVVPWLRGYGDWAWLVAGGMITADSVLPMPSAPAMFTLGVIYGPVLGGLIASLASLLAGLIGYGLVRWLGPRGLRWLVGDADLVRAESFYDRYGIVAVALGKAIGGPAEWVVLLAGVSRMPTGQVVLAIALGAIPAGVVMAALGALAIDQPLLAFVLTVTIAAVVVFFGPRWVGYRPPEGD
ncbi:MAG: VTT domain-containing protein [Myxococcales bacterium]|nr:VTT domain-containing protein [Myxococcales bacterium]